MNQADMIYDLSSIWASVNEEFPYFDRIPFDWDEQYRIYLEKLLQIHDEAEFHQLLKDFLDSLHDGHTKYIPPEKFREGKRKPPTRPEAPSHTIMDGILTIRLNEFLHDHTPFVRDLLESNPDVKLVILDIRENIGGNTFYAANVAQLFISGVFPSCQKWTQIRNAADIAGSSQIVRYSEERLQRYIQDGLLTENDISEARNEMRRTKYETYTDTHGSETNTAVYNGPLQVLISGKTMSAAEDFAAMFRSNHRAVFIGEPTAGSTGTPYKIQLRCGGYAQVVSVGCRLADGTEFIGKGIMPDIGKGEV